MTKKTITRYVEKWKKILNLTNWSVVVKIHNDVNSNALARAEIVYERRSVRLHLYFPHVDRDGKQEDLENSIVHELVHIFFDPFWPLHSEASANRQRVLMIENAVDDITDALIILDRSLTRK